MSGRLVAIPVKDPSGAKSRLAGFCTAEERAALVMHLLAQTVQRLRMAQEIGPAFDIALVTTSPRFGTCDSLRALPVIWDLGIGLSGAAASARAWAEAKGYAALCVLPGDLADPSPAELAQLMSQPTTSQVTLAPALDHGTNALLMPLPNAMGFHYGIGSFGLHQRAALRAGLEPRSLRLSSLARDVDTPADLPHLTSEVRRACLSWNRNDQDRDTYGAG